MTHDRRHPGRSSVAPTSPAAEDPTAPDTRAGSAIREVAGSRPPAIRGDDRLDAADEEPAGNGPPIELSDGQVYGG